MGSAPSEGSSPFVNDSWGLHLFGPEPYPPFLGDGEFAIINPNFWGATKEEQDGMKGWYMFHAVSPFPFRCYSYIDDVFVQWIESINTNVDPKPQWLVVSSHNDHYHLWRDVHRENLLQWKDINPLKGSVKVLGESMVSLHLKEEEMKAQMAALDMKTRELEARLQETKDFTVRLSRLVVKVVEGYMQQFQELSFIKFLLTAVLFGSGGDVSGALHGPDVPPRGSGSGGPSSITTSTVSHWLDSALGDTSPRLPQSGLQCQTPRYCSVRATHSGQRCCPSRHLERLKRATIADFLELEAEQGTMAASWVLGEELALYRVTIFHNSLDCPNCSPWSNPVMVCSESRCHPAHPLHNCRNQEACGCLEY